MEAVHDYFFGHFFHTFRPTGNSSSDPVSQKEEKNETKLSSYAAQTTTRPRHDNIGVIQRYLPGSQRRYPDSKSLAAVHEGESRDSALNMRIFYIIRLEREKKTSSKSELKSRPFATVLLEAAVTFPNLCNQLEDANTVHAHCCKATREGKHNFVVFFKMFERQFFFPSVSLQKAYVDEKMSSQPPSTQW